MPKNWKNRNEQEGVNFWPGFADMAAATCMMLVIFWIAGVLELGGSKDQINKLREEIARLRNLVGKESELQERIHELEVALDQQKKDNNRILKDIAESERKRIAAEKELAALRDIIPSDEPPNIILAQKQDESFVFPSLQATVPTDFEARFKVEMRQAVIDALNSSSNVEMIEIIGHTDNFQVGGKSNVDTNLEAVYDGTKPVDSLKFGSNCELGLARAIAVKSMLENFLKSLVMDPNCGLTDNGRKRIHKLAYRTYSAAQLFPIDPSRRGQDEDRRIEIRFTRLRKEN